MSSGIDTDNPTSLWGNIRGYALNCLTAPLHGFIIPLVQFGSHRMYYTALPILFVSGLVLGVAGFLLWGTSVSLMALGIAMFVIPLLWGDVIMGRLIGVPWGGLGYMCPDTYRVYWTCTAYTFIVNTPAIAATTWFVCAAIRTLF